MRRFPFTIGCKYHKHIHFCCGLFKDTIMGQRFFVYPNMVINQPKIFSITDHGGAMSTADCFLKGLKSYRQSIHVLG